MLFIYIVLLIHIIYVNMRFAFYSVLSKCNEISFKKKILGKKCFYKFV